jgi:hypothetical protein
MNYMLPVKITSITILITCGALLLLNHFADISSTITDVEDLEVALREVKKIVPPEKKIALASSVNDLGLYYRTQFVLAPLVLQNSVGPGDLILYLEHKSVSPLPPLDSSGLLYQKETQNYRVALATRLK